MKFLIFIFIMCVQSAFSGHFIEISGSFETIDQATPTSGSYSIMDSAGTKILLLHNDFSVAEGPDLHIVLSPKELSTLTNGNAMDGATIVAPLKSKTGEQRYDLSDTIDLEGFYSLIIHCIEYSHLFGGAELKSQEISIRTMRVVHEKLNRFNGSADLRGRVMSNNTGTQAMNIQIDRVNEGNVKRLRRD